MAGGFLGRQPVADLLLLDHAARQNLLQGRAIDLQADMDQQAALMVAQQLTSDQELERVLG